MYYLSSKDFGYLITDQKGNFRLKSLKKNLSEEFQQLDDFWDIIMHEDKIFFFDTKALVIKNGEEFELIPFENEYHITARANGEIYSRFWGVGLTKFVNGVFELVPGGEQFANDRVYVILPYSEEELLIGAINKGFFIYDGSEFKSFETEIDEIVNSNLTYPGLALENGNFVINTQGSGAFLINHEGDLINEYSVETGLEGNFVRYVYLDSRDILWLTTGKGISSVDVNSKFKFFGENLPVVTSFKKFDSILFMGTKDGIYYLDEMQAEIIKVPNSNSPVGGFVEMDGLLYSSLQFVGLVEVKKEGVEIIEKNESFANRIGGLWKLENDGNRFVVRRLESIDTYIFNSEKNQPVLESRFMFDEEITGGFVIDNAIWLGTEKSDILIRKKIPNNYGAIDLQELKGDTIPKPTSDNETYIEAFGEIYMVTENEGAFKLNETENEFNKVDLPNANRYDLTMASGGNYDSDGKLFYSMGEGITVATTVGKDSISYNTKTFQELNKMVFYTIYPEDVKEDGSQVVWFGGIDGIVKYEGDLEQTSNKNFSSQIRNIKTANDSIIYAGAGPLPNKLIFDASQNTMIFEYAAPAFKNQQSITYSTKLDGLENSWSEWTRQTSREYLNLNSGNYTFNVRAKNLYGDISEESSFSFAINTPWYLTWWAYLIYALLAVALIYMIVRTRTGILRDRQKELEKSVDERTREVQKRMNELATVNHVSQALTEKLKLNELIQLVGDEMKKLFNSDITYLALLDKENDVVNFPYQDGDNIAPQKFGKGLTSKIIMTGEPLLINKDKDIDAEYEKMGVEHSGKPAISYLGVPIPSEDKIIGVLSVQSTEHESRFNEEDKRLLNTIAINVGVALHNAELYEQARLAKLRAEEANEAKSAFLSTVSHELRTPLTSVLRICQDH